MRSSTHTPTVGASWPLKVATWAGVLFLHIPLALIVLYAFSSEDKSYVFPPPALTTQWFGVAWQREDVWAAIGLSFEVALWSTAIAIVLGSLAAAASKVRKRSRPRCVARATSKQSAKSADGYCSKRYRVSSTVGA